MKKKIILSLTIVFAALIAIMATTITMNASAAADEWASWSNTGVNFKNNYSYSDRTTRSGKANGNARYDYVSSYRTSINNTISTSMSRSETSGTQDSGRFECEAYRLTLIGKNDFQYGKLYFDGSATSLSDSFTISASGYLQHIYHIVFYNDGEYGYTRHAFK